MEERVDAAQVVGREVDLLAEECVHVLCPHHLRELQQQRPRSRARVVDPYQIGYKNVQGVGDASWAVPAHH